MNEKIKAVAMNNGSKSIDYRNRNQKISLTNYDELTSELQDKLLRHLKQNRKVSRLHRCYGCKGDFALRKFSKCLLICRKCYAVAQAKGKIAKRNFVERTVNNIHRFLGGRI